MSNGIAQEQLILEIKRDLIDHFAVGAMAGNLIAWGIRPDNECAKRTYEIAEAMFAERTRRMLDLESVLPTPANPTTPVLAWPIPPSMRVPRLVRNLDLSRLTRSTGQDTTGAYFEDFYDAVYEVYRDGQGYYIIEAGKEYVTYLNVPGASIEHRIMPRPNSGPTEENRA